MRKRTRRLTAAALALGAATIGGVAVAAAPANAANGCSGTLQERQDIRDNTGRVIGDLELYWNSSTGTNCATTVHAGLTAGMTTWTVVELTVCATNQTSSCGGPGDQTFSRQGSYAWYAWDGSGPSAHQCVYARGRIDLSGTQNTIMILPGHCA